MCVKENKKISLSSKFKEINELINNIDLFEKYSLKNKDADDKKNQLFSNEPPFDLVIKVLYILINKEINSNIYYEFSRKNLMNKNIVSKVDVFIPELKKYYLKCKHKKYLENLDEKKVITIFRQILRPYNYNISTIEKYDNAEKYLLYTIEKKKDLTLKKINSVVNFD